MDTTPQTYVIYDGRQIPVALLETRETPLGTQVRVEAPWPAFRVVPSKSHLHPGRRFYWKDTWVMADQVQVTEPDPKGDDMSLLTEYCVCNDNGIIDQSCPACRAYTDGRTIEF